MNNRELSVTKSLNSRKLFNVYNICQNVTCLARYTYVEHATDCKLLVHCNNNGLPILVVENMFSGRLRSRMPHRRPIFAGVLLGPKSWVLLSRHLRYSQA